jgi:hypothetical protein
LISGRLPYNLEREAARVILVDDPDPLRSSNRRRRSDVEIIVYKALEKVKQRRYDSSDALACDIGRFLRDEPIVARTASPFYQPVKFGRRDRALVSGVALGLLMLAVGGAVGTWQAVRALRAEQLAVSRRDQANASRLVAVREQRASTAALRIADSALRVAGATRAQEIRRTGRRRRQRKARHGGGREGAGSHHVSHRYAGQCRSRHGAGAGSARTRSVGQGVHGLTS